MTNSPSLQNTGRCRRVAVLALLGMLAGCASTEPTHPAPERPHARLIGRIPIVWNWRTYELNVSDTGRAFEADIEILCIKGCTTPVNYSDSFSEYFLGAFRAWDGSPHVITVWAGATVFWVIVYDLSSAFPGRVLTVASKTAPTFLVSPEDGSPVIVVDHPRHDAGQGHGAERPVMFRWTGREYRPDGSHRHGRDAKRG